MSERIGNWHAALANNLPDEMDALRVEIVELDRKKADRLALLADYEEFLAIAHRRVASPGVLQTQLMTPEGRFLSGSEVAA
jgi:hypothetical protein